MFPLWSRKEMKPLANTKKPSQKHQGNHEDSARNPDDSWGGKSGSSGRFCFIEGTSPLASALLLGRTCLRWAKNKALGRTYAGMTVEASILLPLFLFVFLNLGCAIEMIRLHGNLQLALWQIGRELSLYGYVLDSGEAPENGAQEDDPWWKDLGGIVFASTYVRNKLVQLAGKDYLEASPLTRGADGLALWESDIFGEGDTMDMVITYSVSPWITIAGFPSFRMANRYYAHIWNGYGLPEEGEGEAQEKLVYVTANASVYHLSRDCTHLRLSVREISAEEIEWVKNLSGRRYRACEKCVKGEGAGAVYIADAGDCYHESPLCSGLKRTIYSIKIEEAVNLRPCGRCGQTGN